MKVKIDYTLLSQFPFISRKEFRILFNKFLLDEKVISAERKKSVNHYIDFLIFESKREPQKFINLIKQNLIRQNNESFLEINNPGNAFENLSQVLDLIDIIEVEINSDGLTNGEAQHNYLLTQLFNASCYIISDAKGDFSTNDLIQQEENTIKNNLQEQMKPFLNSYLEKLLLGLVQEKIIVHSGENRYYLREKNLRNDELSNLPHKNTADGLFQFTFINKPPPVNNPERNDDYWPQTFAINKHNFEITIKPINTPYWRFGFRYSKTDTFPPINEARHNNESIVDIHICVGDMRSNRKWHNANRVYLQSYNVLHRHNPRLIEDNYKGEDIILTVKSNSNSSQVYFELRSNVKILYQNEFNLNSYNFCLLGAWSDFNNYTLSTNIKVVNRLHKVD